MGAEKIYVKKIETVSRRLSMAAVRVRDRSKSSGESVVDKVSLGQVFSTYFDFLATHSFQQLLQNHHHPSSRGGGTIGQQMTSVLLDLVPLQPKKEKDVYFFTKF
jgi:hypothetical protein